MNPILIRHLYGSVRRKRFFWFLSLYLLGIGLLALFVAAVAGIPLFFSGTSQTNTTFSMLDLFTGGRMIYWFSGVILILTSSLLVPISALGAFAGERENRTLDLLITTTLKVRSIVLGKLGSALLTGAIYVLAPLPLLMTGFWLGGVTTTELGITLLFLVLAMLSGVSSALLISAFLKRTIAAVLIFYGLTLASAPVITILATATAGLADAWKYSALLDVQPFWIEALVQYGWVILAGLHPLTAAIVTEAMGFEQNSWLLLHFTVERYSPSAAGTTLGTLTLPSPWITYTLFTLIATAIMLRITAWRLKRPER
ncbi:MAG: ABC transporter permease subunit [Anaerolineae bacterium]|jgi:ABC-type transport system involved in multi-copper enzyme maturation permease subunit